MKVIVDLNDFQFKLFQGGWDSNTYESLLEFILKSSMKFGNLCLLGEFKMGNDVVESGNVGVNSTSLSMVLKFLQEKSSFVRGTKVPLKLGLKGSEIIE